MSDEQTTAIQTQAGERKAYLETVQARLEEQTPRLQAYLAKMHGDPDRFRAVILQAVATNPMLMRATPSSIVTAALESAQLGLEPTGILGGAWILPYWSAKKKAYEAKLIVGYRGYVDLMRRAGGVKSIEARVVYEGDVFSVEYGSHPRLAHIPAFMFKRPKGERKCVYWRAELEGGIVQFDVLEMSEIEKARKSSKSADRGPWIDWYDPMAEKTAIRRAVSVLPISVWEARRAVQLENEAEEEAAPAPANEGASAQLTARDKALALLDDGDGRGSAPEEAAAGATEPAAAGVEDAVSPSTSEPESVQAGRPTASDDLPLDDEELPELPPEA